MHACMYVCMYVCIMYVCMLVRIPFDYIACILFDYKMLKAFEKIPTL